jgi:hypothetical protein
MKDGILKYASIDPDSNPKRAPIAAHTMNIGINPSFMTEKIDPIPEMRMMEPSDISIDPIDMTNIIPNPPITIENDCCSTLDRFFPVKVLPSVIILNTTKMMTTILIGSIVFDKFEDFLISSPQ